MIVVKLMGGLGNQMFQYAAARALAIESGKDVVFDKYFLYEHNRSNETFTAREFELDIFPNIRCREIGKTLSHICQSRSFINRNLRKLFLLFGNRYLDGYFQSEDNFVIRRETIISDFTFPELDSRNLDILQQIENAETGVSLHIRRGDYLKKGIFEYHGVLPLNYYESAIKYLKENISASIRIFIFTDDPDWAKDCFPLENAVVVEGNVGKNSWKDMALMTHCRHNIIANSSFSWWGAWLNRHPDKTVIAPAKWVKGRPENAFGKLIPKGWVRI